MVGEKASYAFLLKFGIRPLAQLSGIDIVLIYFIQVSKLDMLSLSVHLCAFQFTLVFLEGKEALTFSRAIEFFA